MKNLLILILHILIFTSCNIFSGNSKNEELLFSKIKKGMNVNEVTQILGNPDYMVQSTYNKEIYYYYFTENKSVMRSEMPLVLFDSTNIVIFSTYGIEKH